MGITLRSVKGSPLTHTEMDNNFKVVEATEPSKIEVGSSNDALRITQTGYGNALVVEDSSNPDSTPFVITSNGKVVTGNTAFENEWYLSGHIISNCSVTKSSNTSGYGAVNYSGPSGYLMLRSAGTNVGYRGIVSSGDEIGSIRWGCDDGVTAYYIPAASIRAYVDGTPGVNDMPGRLVFSTTADGANTPTERMRIDSAGRFGIGTTPVAGRVFTVASNITGATGSYTAQLSGVVQSDVVNAYYANTFTQTASNGGTPWTLTSVTGYAATQGTFHADSTVTTQYGFAASSSLTGATNNYGFYGNIASAANRFNFYAAGTADNSFSGNVYIHGAGKLGYTTGSGGAVTQLTSRTTGVTLNKTNGAITLVSAAGSTSWQTFTVTNSTVSATDTVHVCQKSGTDLNMVHVTAVAAGSFNISFATTGGTTTEQPVFNFAVISGVTS